MVAEWRRQPVLREAQVARLFGEETFRQIVQQSQTMPEPVPLAFGCGYVRAGDWMAARRELDEVVPHKPTGIQRVLSAPYCGYRTLRELMAEVRVARLRALRPAAMGFTSLSDLISEATTGGKRQQLYYQKASFATIAGAAYSLWQGAGIPGVGDAAPPAPTGAACVATTNGALAFVDPAAGDTLHLVSVAGFSTVAAGALLFYDRLYHVAPSTGVATSQPVTGVPTRYTDGRGVLVFAEVHTALGATVHNLTINYINESGVSGRSITVAGIASAAVQRLDHSVGYLFMPLQAGDAGVRAITSIQFSAAPSGAINVCQGYPYCWLPLGVANVLYGVDLINTQFNLAQVWDNACISALLAAATTSSGLIQATLVAVSG